MDESTFKLALLGLIIVGLLCFSSIAVAGADAGASSNPTLEEGHVAPKNGVWGSTFTYEVIYTDNENNIPAAGYPKIYIDGGAENMVENDPTDNDVTDGKVFKHDWTTAKENVGSHGFYFYVETSSGENARDPATGAYDGPEVKKRSVSLSCEVDNPEPATGETITFSGHLRTIDENLGVTGGNLILYKLLLNNDVGVSSTTTDENGYFTLSIDAPSSGIFCYKTRFPGDNYCEARESSTLYVNTLNKSLVFGLYAVVLLALVGAAMFLLSRGIAKWDYLKLVLLGFLLGLFLVFVGAGIIGVLAAGGITGYLFARATREWTKHLRIGCMIGFIFLSVFGLLFAYYLTGMPKVVSPDILGLKYSVTQMEVYTILFSQTISSLIFYALLAGIGAILGGYIRKTLKPTEQNRSGSEGLPAAG